MCTNQEGNEQMHTEFLLSFTGTGAVGASEETVDKDEDVAAMVELKESEEAVKGSIASSWPCPIWKAERTPKSNLVPCDNWRIRSGLEGCSERMPCS